jgi:hypothetical protein
MGLRHESRLIQRDVRIRLLGIASERLVRELSSGRSRGGAERKWMGGLDSDDLVKLKLKKACK